jgi:hypothetical protein
VALKIVALKHVTLKKSGLWALLLAPLAMITVAAQASDLQDGNAAFDAGRYADALRLWSAGAATGDPEAVFDLGLLYDLGDGVAENAMTAFGFYRRAGEAGLATGQFNVGVMYDSGRGVAQNEAEAAIWYARAAAQGHTRAAFNLGQLYETGTGVPLNTDVAIAWYGVAAKTIPIAATKAQALAKGRPSVSDAPLLPPVPAWPRATAALRLAGDQPVTELVWTAPAEPRPVHFFVELRALTDGRYREVYAGYVDTSAEAVTLTHDRDFAWRVYAVAEDGSGYAPGPWSVFIKGSPEQDASLQLR